MPPVPPIISEHFGSNEIIFVNDAATGTQLIVKTIKGIPTVIVLQEDGKSRYIKMDTWKKNRKYYESKYGKLPPPPPPAPKIGCVDFAAPVIKQDN